MSKLLVEERIDQKRNRTVPPEPGVTSNELVAAAK
jgi:hypothetical protein